MFNALKVFFKTDEIKRSEDDQKRVSDECEKLKLYHMHNCPYCMRVRKAAKRLALNIEQRDINVNQEWEQELVRHGGKRQVPCLKITGPDGKTQWLYESIDIINYLTDRFRK